MIGRIKSNKPLEAANKIEYLQLMKFSVAGTSYGINIAKVRGILQYSKYSVTPMPNANPFVEGVFTPRDETITVIDLGAYMSAPPSDDQETDILILTKINDIETAFHVHEVETIIGVPLQDIQKPDATIYDGEKSIATGIARIGEEHITIIDFEKILYDITPSLRFDNVDFNGFETRENTTKPILIVEDSPLLESMTVSSLKKAGYVNVACTSNGQEAWDLLRSYKESDKPIEQLVAAIIADIEMPVMDGYTLLRLIKGDHVLKKIPVFLFSSTITDDTCKRGAELGAVGSVSKPKFASVLSLLDKHLL